MSSIPICFYCKHRLRGTLKCSAFGGKAIPYDILLGKMDHEIPFPGQETRVVFEPQSYFRGYEESLITKMAS